MIILNALKSIKSFILFVLFLLGLHVVYATPAFFKPNPKLTLEENKYLSDELNDFDWVRDEKEVFLEKYNILNSVLDNNENISSEFEIQLIKSQYLLAQAMGDTGRQLNSLESYIQKYKDASEGYPFQFYQAFCTLKQFIDDDKTQTSCFIEVEKLMNEFSSDILDEGRKRLFLYQKVLVNYFANNRKETDSLCVFVEGYENNSSLDKDGIGLFIKSSIDGYYSSSILSDEDTRNLKCLARFL